MMKENFHVLNKDTKLHDWNDRDDLNTKNEQYYNRNGVHKQDKEHFYQDLVIQACMMGNINIIEEYLEDHNVNLHLYTGWTLLLYATSYSNVEVIKYLLTRGADSNHHKDGFTPLMALCSSKKGTIKNCLHCLSLLLEASANVDATNKQRQTALMYACKIKEVEFVKELIKHIKDINVCDNEGQTALFYAVLANKLETVKLLIENQIDVTIENRWHQTAKDVAVSKGYEKISSLFSTEDDIQPLTCEIFYVEKWSDMFPRLCLDKNQLVDHDIATILYGMGLESYTYLFKGIGLQKFLLLTEKDLLNLGIDISVHRNKFLSHLHKFHSKRWNVQTIGAVNKSEPYTLYNGITSMGNITKQIIVMNATFRYIKSNLDDISYKKIFDDETKVSEYKEVLRNTEKALTNVKKELLHVQTLVDKINVESLLPALPCYIKPRRAKYCSSRPIIFSILLICGIYLIKVRIYK